jgi:hypothetical protein
MPTTTRTSAQLLAFAIKEFGDADALVKRRTKDVANARERANATSGLTAAAERAFNNADADYRLLYEKAETAAAEKAPSQKVVSTAEAVLREAEAVKEAIGGCHTPLKDAIFDAGKCVTQIDTAVARLGDSMNALQQAGTDAPRGSKSPFSNALTKLRAPYARLQSLQEPLQNNQANAKEQLDNVPGLPSLERLRDLVRELKGESSAADAESDAKPSVDAADLERLQGERDAAELDWRQAPEIERTAQADLTAKENALIEAKKFLESATAARDEAEDNFIERVDVGRPNPDGIVEARVIFVNGGPPADYQVRWTVEAGELVDPVGTVVRIKTQGVPDGNYAIEAHLERA